LACGRSAESRRSLGDGLREVDRIGGLLRYGIPEFKMEKRFLQRASTSWTPKA
jgi:hypothetical protein